MAKHEPWFKPRDEDGDDELINWLGGHARDNNQNKSKLGCPLTAAPAVGVVVAPLAARSLTKGKK